MQPPYVISKLTFANDIFLFVFPNYKAALIFREQIMGVCLRILSHMLDSNFKMDAIYFQI